MIFQDEDSCQIALRPLVFDFVALDCCQPFIPVLFVARRYRVGANPQSATAHSLPFALLPFSDVAALARDLTPPMTHPSVGSALHDPQPDVAGSVVTADASTTPSQTHAVQPRQAPATIDWAARHAQDGAAVALGVRAPFAAIHPLTPRSTLLASDRFASLPVVYNTTADPLCAGPRADIGTGRELALDPQAIYDYLYFHVIPSPRTVFKDVRRLPPAHAAISDGALVRPAPYWTPDFKGARSTAKATSGAASFDSLKAEFRALLQQAVADRLDGSKPACFLSGGTDSSTVAGMIGLAAGHPAAAYSIGFDAQGYDEMVFARIAAKQFGCQHHEYYVTPDDLVRGIPLVAAHYDQPFGNSSAVPAYYCAKMAKDDGVTRILAGDGGDELFGGNTRYAQQRLFGVYDDLPGFARGLLKVLFDNPLMSRVPLVRKVASYVHQARVPMPDRLQTYNLLERLGVQRVLTPTFLAMVDPEDPHRQQRAVWKQARNAGALDRQLAFDWRYTLAENDLPKVVGTTALAGIDVSFPMLDERLVDFSMKLPTHYKLKGLKLRWFFKEALRGFLPDEILAKKKQGFGLPFGVWVVQHAALRALATDSLRSLSTRGMVQPAFVDALLTEHLPSHPHYYGEMVWILMMLEQWLQSHAPDFRIGL